jgi:DnaJ-class molecular chaperone
VLSDDEKRRKYDMHGEAGLDANARQERQDPFDFFRQFGFGSSESPSRMSKSRCGTPRLSYSCAPLLCTAMRTAPQ